MPNLTPPITTAEAANAYRDRILAALPQGSGFKPLMVAYLTNGTDPDALATGYRDGAYVAAKLYPAHATTNSSAGVTDIRNIDGVLERMAEIGMPLLVHGEVTDPAVDIFDREAVFIDKILEPLVNRLPALRIVFEHATTERAVQFVRQSGDTIGATITPHHLLLNRNAMFQGGIRPHHYCLPVVKREKHRLALVEAATSGDAHFFLGTDSAPHAVAAKENACGCAGIFNAPTAIELYAEIFDAAGALDRLEGFASLNGPRFYGLPVNEQTMTLERSPMTVPDAVALPDGGEIRPFRAGETLAWRIVA
jgi:dihydroorotase